MAAVQQRVLNWLYSVLTSEYQDVNRTYNDVAQTLSHYSSLTPRTEVYTYENGVSALLLQISGTIPVLFRGTTYRFPICMWIPHAYPNEAPIVYVTPTEGMVVRAGQHVDPQGKVYHPYLVGWAQYKDKSNVLDFVAILRDIFAKEPPVVARQQRSASLNQPPAASPPPLPPLPPNVARSTSRASSDGAVGPPPPPPKQAGPPVGETGPRQSTSGPPLPPLPPGALGSPNSPHEVLPYQNPQPHQPTRQSSLRYETAPPLPQQAPPRHDQRSSSYGTVSSPEAYRSPQSTQQPPIPSQYGPPPPTYTQSWPPPNQQPYNSAVNNLSYPPPQWQQTGPPQSAVKPKAPPPPDLIDAPLVLPDPYQNNAALPAPPIPPNPEKDMLLQQLAEALYAQRQHSRSQAESSLPGLKAQNAAMLTALSSMQAEMQALESLSAMLSSNTSILHKALHDADAVIESSQHRAPPGVDEILVAPTVVGNQLYDLVSEERSLGDALFILGRAVEKGRISPAVFTKMTRSLAREWYLKKALVKKIGRGMGLTTEFTVYPQTGESYYSR